MSSFHNVWSVEYAGTVVRERLFRLFLETTIYSNDMVSKSHLPSEELVVTNVDIQDTVDVWVSMKYFK